MTVPARRLPPLRHHDGSLSSGRPGPLVHRAPPPVSRLRTQPLDPGAVWRGPGAGVPRQVWRSSARPWRLVFLIAVGTVLLIPGILVGPYHDAAIFGAVGKQMAAGAVLYRDVWDHKPPGIYLIAWLAALMPGGPWPYMWAGTAAAVGLGAYLLEGLTGFMVAVLALVGMAIWPGALGGGQTESFAVLPAVAAFLLASREQWFLAGIASGLSLVFSLESLPMIPALATLGLLRGHARTSSLIWLGVGAASVAAIAMLWLAAGGGLGAAIDILVSYNRVYLGSDRTGDLAQAWEFFPVLLPLSTAAVFGSRLRLSQRRLDRLDVAALVWLSAAVLSLAFVQGRLLAHYVTILVIPLAVLARGCFSSKLGGPATVAALTFAAVLGTAGCVASLQTDLNAPTRAIGAWISSHTTPSATILDWGVEANIYLSANRAVAGRYPYLMPLVTPRYTTRQMVSDWVSDLQAHPPAIIVDSESANAHWADGEDFLRVPPPGAAGGRDLDIVQPLRDFVATEYHQLAEIDGRKIYALNAPGGPS